MGWDVQRLGEERGWYGDDEKDKVGPKYGGNAWARSLILGIFKPIYLVYLLNIYLEEKLINPGEKNSGENTGGHSATPLWF